MTALLKDRPLEHEGKERVTEVKDKLFGKH